MTVVKTNGYLEKYYEDCKSGVHIIGMELMMELENLITDMQGDEYLYDTTEADLRMDFIENCIKLTKSPFYGQPMKLLDWQKAFISSAYSFKLKNGLNRFQRVLLLISRKNAKSETCSALLLTDLILGGKGRDIVCSSNDDAQADILYNACDTMRLMIDPESLDTWRNQKALDAYHSSPLMADVARLREKYDLHMKAERYTKDEMPEEDNSFIRK